MFTKSVMTPRVFSDLPEPCGVQGERARWVAVAAVLDPDMFGSDPDVCGLDPDMFGLDPDIFGLDPYMFKLDPDIFGSDPYIYGKDPDIFGLDSAIFASDPDIFGSNPDQIYYEGLIPHLVFRTVHV